MQIYLIHTENFTARGIHFFMKLYCKIKNMSIPDIIYNHAAMYDEVTDYIYEADFPRVVRISHEDWSKKKKNKTAIIKVIHLTTNTSDRRILLEYLNAQVGKKYEVVNFLWHIIRIFTGKWYGSLTDNQHYCYELVIRAVNYLRGKKIYEFLNPIEASLILTQRI